MKKINIIIMVAGVASMMFASCKKVLDKQDLGSFTADQVYNDSITTVLSINYIYAQNQPLWFGNVGGFSGSINSLTDEQYGTSAFTAGTNNVDAVTDIGSSNTAGNYVKIRSINMFIRDVTAGTMPDAVKKRFIAQALFWRALRYFELVKLYGGVPLVLVPQEALGADAKAAALVPRAKTSEVFAQIKADLDIAVRDLPVYWPNNADYGRITAGAAQAYEGRVLLYQASPQFNRSNDQAKWQAAFDANLKAVQLLALGGYGLYPKYDVTMWTTQGGSGGKPVNPEAVFVTQFNNLVTTDQNAATNTYPNNTVPRYIGTGTPSNAPTWNLVQAYPMKDGKDTTSKDASLNGNVSKYAGNYSLQKFFLNRDPRFDATIAFNGANWPLNGNSSYRIWTYNYNNRATGTNNFVTAEPAASSSSGLYLRKAIDPSLTSSTFDHPSTDWIDLRYTEVLMNLAEAAAELNHTGEGQEAYTNLIAIRKRAGIEIGDGFYGIPRGMNHDQLINFIVRERQIEFAFEGKRFWDVRRRMLVNSLFNGKKRLGMYITLAPIAGTSTDYLALTRDNLANTLGLDAMYNTYFTVRTTSLDVTPLAFSENNYFFGIPTATLQNDPNVAQTNLWGGTFDPLQ